MSDILEIQDNKPVRFVDENGYDVFTGEYVCEGSGKPVRLFDTNGNPTMG